MKSLIQLNSLLIIIFISFTSAHSQWVQLSNSPMASGRFDDMYFINPNTGWVIHGSSRVYKTIDGGASWILSDSIGNSVAPRSITALDENNLFIGSLNPAAVLFKSSDGGFNWTLVTNIPAPQPQGLCGIYSLGGKYIFGCGKYSGFPTFIKSTDAGNTWISKDMSNYAGGLVDCYFINKDSGFVVGGIGADPSMRTIVLFTSDGGNSWINRFTGTRAGERGWKISFPDRDNGYVSLEYQNTPDQFLKSTDGGNTWVNLPFPNYFLEQGVGFINANTGWIGGYANTFRGTTDGGMTWFDAGIGRNVNRFRFFGDSIGYACGLYVYKYDKTVGISPISLFNPEDFYLSQNYPNPFNPVTNPESLLIK